jgi:hypothetical protein
MIENAKTLLPIVKHAIQPCNPNALPTRTLSFVKVRLPRQIHSHFSEIVAPAIYLRPRLGGWFPSGRFTEAATTPAALSGTFERLQVIQNGELNYDVHGGWWYGDYREKNSPTAASDAQVPCWHGMVPVVDDGPSWSVGTNASNEFAMQEI